MKPRIVFMGSPDFALPILQKLVENYQVIGVVTQPDRPAGRGKTLTPPPIKKLAMEIGLEVIQPERLKTPEAFSQLQEWQPDVIIVAAFGQILRKNVLELPQFGCINVHASLLPRWRGAAPIQAAILNGDVKTGVTIMKMDAGVDTGAILRQRELSIQTVDTAESLSQRLSPLGADLLIETLPDYLIGKIEPTIQDDTQATYASLLKKEEGKLDFEKNAVVLERQVRAYIPWPGTFIEWQGQAMKINGAKAMDGGSGLPGQRTVVEGFPAIQCKTGCLVLVEVQPAGKKSMNGQVFLRGARQWLEPILN
jgi:methionyl-tRNA formyltransferase